ncbi:protein RKD4 [Alnus glutinosa]|uniref:protein RKD4 n=1 Tax=Alnus glutinosa TaxID=3517 RepID=UPI002D7783B1|nr:protein RKD4 [Alnus glutinosa]
MDSNSTHLNIPKIENPHGFDWFPEEQSEKLLELPPLDSFFDFDSTLPFLHNTKQFGVTEFQDFEDPDSDFFWAESKLPFLYEDVVVDQKPLNSTTEFDTIGHNYGNLGSDTSESSMVVLSEYASSSSRSEEERRSTSGRKKSAALELDEIQRHFNVPITKAAKEMNVGLTVLKKRCRELNIMRWPHRKIKSLKSLINNVKELGLTNEVVMLEEHKRLLEILPDMQLTQRTKKLRQACFKANYKKRRSLTIQA